MLIDGKSATNGTFNSVQLSTIPFDWLPEQVYVTLAGKES